MVQFQDSSNPTGVTIPDDNGKNVQTAQAARHRKANAAVQMKLAGATWEEIAKAVGYPTPRAALVATEQALGRQLANREDRAAMRDLAGARLERLLRSAWPKAIDPNSPEHLFALTKCKEVIDRHAKLFGLDAPTEVIVHTPTQNELEQWVARVVETTGPNVQEFDIIEGEILDDYEAEDWLEGEEGDGLPS